MQLSIPSMTLSSTSVDSLNSSPPCTTRCPTACTSAVLLISDTPDCSEAM